MRVGVLRVLLVSLPLVSGLRPMAGRRGISVLRSATVGALRSAAVPRRPAGPLPAATTDASVERRGPAPKLVIEGDTLTSTWWQKALLGGCWVTSLFVLQGILAHIHGVGDLLGALGVLAYSIVFADFFSGFFHWTVDNYGGLETPIFGTVIAAFQGHHDAPWTITYRDFANNVYKICYAALPGLLATVLAQRFLGLSPALAIFSLTYFNGQILSQEFHRYSHMTVTDLPAWADRLQRAGIMLSRKEHGVHHKAPHMGRYSILNGMTNGVLDRTGFWRRLELLVYRLSGQEPNTWKLDADLKRRTLAGDFAPPRE